jgi:hypothetical protein
MAIEYKDLSDFTKGYVDAIFFTECEIGTFKADINPESHAWQDGVIPHDVDLSDFAPETLSRIIRDCAGFEMTHKKLLQEAYDLSESQGGSYNKEHAGHDFWLTRNGHGAGYWDRGLGEIGNNLTKSCGFRTRWDTFHVYYGQDKLIRGE